MPRPLCERRIGQAPGAGLFKPAGVACRNLEEVSLGMDEFEALRLADYEGLYQEAGALRMGVSRQTFARILEEARKKTAQALVEGLALRIAECPAAVKAGGQGETMKIALPARDGQVDSHFGHCAYFEIYSIEEGKIVSEARLEAPEACGCKSGIAGELARLGVKKLLAGNIGEGAFRVLSSYGIEVVRGASGPTRGAVEALLAGKTFEAGANCHEHGEGHSPCHHEV